MPTTEAISQTLDRLSETPVKMLFERVAVPLAVARTPRAWLEARRLIAIDEVKLDAPDTPANIANTTCQAAQPAARSRRSRLSASKKCDTDAVVAAEIGTVSVGEREVASALARALEPRMLVIADRRFFSF